MTTTPPDRSTTRNIPAVHALIAPSNALQRERRALYQFAAELLEPGGPQVLEPDVIDCPLTRHRIGEALAGRTSLACSTLVGINAVSTTVSGGQDIPVTSRPEANTLFADALDTVVAELGRQQAASGSPELLTEADGERFNSTLTVLRDGITLARSVSIDLINDLLTHIALVGFIDSQRAGRLVSASPRTFPGLVLLRIPRSTLEVAEALVHEGAHQKLFDLAITHDLLNADSDRCPLFHPPWAPKEYLWPLEQTLAAWHAYACLARFAHDAGVTACVPEAGSLLPVASERSKILGRWLLDKGDYLGADAHTLLDGFIGQRPHTAVTTGSRAGVVATDYVIDAPLDFRRCGSPKRVLVGRRSHPPQLYWVSDDAAAVLEILGQKSLDEVTHILAQRSSLPQFDAAHRLTALLSELIASGLLTVSGTTSTDLC